MNEFDDSVLRDQLQRLGGHGPDEDNAYLCLQQRVRLAKRRRAAAVLGSLGVTLMIGFAIGSYGGPSASHLAPADGGNDVFVTSSAVSNSTESTEPTTDSVEVTSATEASDTSVASPSGNGNGPANTQSHSGPGKTGSSVPNSSTASTLQPPVTTKTDSTLASVPPTNSLSKTSMGGTVTASLQKGVISLVSHVANPGWSFSIDKQDPDRLKVRFELDGNTSHIEFTIAADGTLQGAVNES
jgi:hypothetical protein